MLKNYKLENSYHIVLSIFVTYLTSFLLSKKKINRVTDASLLLNSFGVKHFKEIAKKLLISAGTVHVRVKKMEDAGIIKGSSLTLDYKKLGYSFIAYIGIYLEKTHQTKYVLERLSEIPNVTVAHITTGKFNIYCKVRAKSTEHAKDQ